ncbi:MAG: molecular chaperone HtpG [Halobacteriovoraceae bacterium]|nr:molecular chaperone HtpG [Halobacteriovoraceae bacterium]|tara:strand:- start:30066 stop:31991 length:1926 start_codon:yes stop_codon:yes gene_type:complete
MTENVGERKGTISVQTGDIFPIIKKWLYSEHDIFLRELVSNSTDAITKRATLGRTENVEIPEGEIKVYVNKEAKTVTIEDNGLGMTEEEIEKYIAQLAFSGAEEFVNKMKDAGETADIIGKFGLGFYSAFMVADKVEVESLSWREGSKPAKWICEGDVDYTFTESNKEKVGTSITMHINEESSEFLGVFKVLDILRKYCDFMPYKIEVIDTKIRKNDKGEEEGPKSYQVNETEPLWRKDPSELKDQDYLDFYKKLYPMDSEPLFWLHLKVDHPFTLEGILYFPKINPKMPFNEKNIRLYSKQVFVSDNVKNIIPEFLSLLKGTIDSTDIPLNVSRSSLQGDPNIKKISNYVVKKVAESLKKLFNNDREKFESIWSDSGLFVKYGCVSDTKFDELMRERIIFKNSDQKYVTLPEFFESIPEQYKEKLGEKALYFEKDKADHAIINQLKDSGIMALEMDDHIDPHFMQHAEMHAIKDKKVQFASVDSEIANLLETENTTDEDMKVQELFKKVLIGKTEKKEGEDAAPDSMDIEIQKIKGATTPAYYKVDEQMKRFQKMAESMGQGGAQAFPLKKTLVINPTNPLIQNALKLHEQGSREDLVERIVHYVGDLASISSEGLKNEDKEQFVKRSQDLIQDLTSQLQ